ncbi:MAG TPA: amidohydrolase family protein [Casimicrobiaceae bacterium]|nr:amidohydrolase family protein [Casimicrobiaceae bacterium]
MKKIDIFPHIFPRRFFDTMLEIAPDKNAIKRWLHIPVLYDLDARLRMMDTFGPEYQQVLTLSLPTIEAIAPADKSPEVARLANDGMAEISHKYPDRFPGWVASLPLNNVPACLDEIERTIEHMGARGIQIFTNVNGRPLDDPEFAPIFEKMHAYDLPIWMHPTRGPKMTDYAAEPKSRYEIWWLFGWPYETSAAMARMVFSGFFDRWPNLKIITHHMGAMVPYLEARVGLGMDQLGTRTAEEDYTVIVKNMQARGRRPVDYFHQFYADTSVNGSAPAIRCGLSFFGIDRCMFGTDCPFDPEGGPMFIRESIRAIESLKLSPQDLAKLYEANARAMLRLSEPHANCRYCAQH